MPKQNRLTDDEITTWYARKVTVFAPLSRVVRSTLDALLDEHRIDRVAVSARVKEKAALVGKVRKKKYHDLDRQVTDLCGARIILYRESEVARVCKILEDNFNVSREDSSNKGILLNANQLGYQSTHFVCDLGKERCQLAENRQFADARFEVQVRTVLQHAWAEIEHDIVYKNGVAIPPELKRRLYLVAGILESADRELEMVSTEVDRYAEAAKTSSELEGAFDVHVAKAMTTEALRHCGVAQRTMPDAFDASAEMEAMQELKSFGVKTRRDLRTLLDSGVARVWKGLSTPNTWIGGIRDSMMFKDPERYFDRAWSRHWEGMDEETYSWLVKIHGKERVDQLLDAYGLEVAGDEYEYVE